jgi:hypothetical protein
MITLLNIIREKLNEKIDFMFLIINDIFVTEGLKKLLLGICYLGRDPSVLSHSISLEFRKKIIPKQERLTDESLSEFYIHYQLFAMKKTIAVYLND